MSPSQKEKQHQEDTSEQLSQRFEQVKSQLEQKLSSLESRVDKLQQNRKEQSKKKSGRPSKKVEDRASERVIFRLKPSESEQLQELAEPGESVGQTARRLLIKLIKEAEQKSTS